jgi:hypothetical protein
MPDISMCKNRSCPSSPTCHRFTAEPNPHWQSYGAFEHDDSGACSYYWPTDPKVRTTAEPTVSAMAERFAAFELAQSASDRTPKLKSSALALKHDRLGALGGSLLCGTVFAAFTTYALGFSLALSIFILSIAGINRKRDRLYNS